MRMMKGVFHGEGNNVYQLYDYSLSNQDGEGGVMNEDNYEKLNHMIFETIDKFFKDWY